MAKKHKRGSRSGLPALVAVIGVLVLLLAAGCAFLLTRYTWALGRLWEKNTEQLELRGEEITIQDYYLLRERFPEAEIRWDVPIQGRRIPWDSTEITLSDLSGADRQTLALFPNLTRVELEGPVNNERLEELFAQYPQISFHWTLSVGNTNVENTAQRLDLAGQPVTWEELDWTLHWMPNLRELNLLGCPLTDDQVLQLAEAYPNCHILWELEINGQKYRTDVEELDLSGWQVGSSQTVEKLLSCFFSLKRVIMSDCGLDDETMDALDKRYTDIRFIWTVYIKDVPIRTDAKWFYPFKYQKDMVVGEEDLYPLRYCVDMEAIDIGHMTTVETCDWAAYMPNLKYLIIVETAITDISPLANLKNLVFLEIFTTKITDYSPLLGCTSLEDLNLGQTYGDPEPILQMTWLKNLWWSGIEGTYGLPCSDAPQRLREALPNTNMKFNLETPNVNNGWRQLENYYAMRDLMDVFYLT